MSISSGKYIIVNVRQKNLAYLADPNDGTPLSASYEQTNKNDQWNVNELSNGNYTIKSVGNNMFAVAGNRAGEDAVVEGRSDSQQWTIQETRYKGHFTIATTDTRLFWGIIDNQQGTPVSLSKTATDTRNSWVFTSA